MLHSVTADAFRQQYASVFEGDARWQKLPVPTGDRFNWDGASTYVRKPPFLEGLSMTPAPPKDLVDARALAVLGDSITTDHISPAGNIKANSPAGKYLIEHGVDPKDFNSYGARRGNHEVMMRGTFANTRIKNQMVPGVEGGVTAYLPGGDVMPIYDAAMKYQQAGVPLVIIAGKEYGSGSSRDWAAKGTMLLGVKAVIAESYERIHRSNLVNMGVLPLQFKAGQNAAAIGLTGRETFSFDGAGAALKPRGEVIVTARAENGSTQTFTVTARIDTPEELVAYSQGGILPYVLRQLVKKSQ
jgi:aconitate hydratase